MWSLPFLKDQDTPTLIQLDKKLPEKEVVRQVYKWKDSEGVWQYSDAPPPEGTEVATLSVSNKANIIQSVKVPEEEPENTISPTSQISSEAQKTLEEAADEDVLSFDRALNIMEEAKAVRELMNARNQHLNEIAGGSD
ncbi:DUF4124 domain-containing protein [Hahella ganghwensis]|uniref:DUF4124 domain-containing protein n=1 Tax=Hahella ganghwensis TaxID=286420 RepID=UPI000363FCAF|nr:DUF4124 domain-containing protein [Hahella ganghwensis]